MGHSLRVISGADGGPWTSTLMNDGVVVSYPGTATFDASVWRGGDEAPLFAPAVDWIDSTMGTFRVFIPASFTAALEEGTYRIQIFVDSAGVRSEAFDGFLEILSTTGGVTPSITWCDQSDVLLYSSTVSDLQAKRQTNDASGFLLQRVQATAKRSRMLVKRYMPRLGFVKVRQNTLDPFLDSMDIPSATAVPPSKFDLTAAFGRVGGIVLEEQLREIVARDAISLILRRQATTSMPYRQEAEAQEAMADEIFKCYQAQVVTAAPIGGNTNFLIDMDCIVLPAGISP